MECGTIGIFPSDSIGSTRYRASYGRNEMSITTAVIHLRGHGTTAAEVEITRYSPLVWLGRVLGYVAAWIGGTFATLVITFDPFVASFPLVIGLGYSYQAVRGRYRVDHFEGACPRCHEHIRVRPGSRIPIPHSLVCFNCHHEPELRLVEAS